MDITKVFMEHFKFGWIWEVDQILKETREWNKSVIGKSNVSQLARTMMGTQQLVLELESCAKDSFLRAVLADKQDIQFHEEVWGKEKGKKIHMMLEKFNKTSEQISIAEIEEFTQLVPEQFRDKLQQGLQAIKQLSVIMHLPSPWQISDILAHFPKMHNLVRYANKRNNRKPQGLLLFNNDIQGVYYGRRTTTIKMKEKNKPPPENELEFHNAIVEARICLTRKLDSACNKRALLLKIWSYMLHGLARTPKKPRASADQGNQKKKKQKVV